MTRTLVLSDLHLGSAEALLGRAVFLERLREVFKGADRLVLAGDVWDLVFSSWERAIDASRPFFKLVGEEVPEVVYLPGNHDHHFVDVAGNEARISQVVDDDVERESPPGSLLSAERVIDRLTGGGLQVKTAYPLTKIDGVTYTHGHYLDPHQRGGLGWNLVDRLGWRLAGLKRDPGQKLRPADYEALISPVQALLFQVAQLEGSEKVRRRDEKRLTQAASVLAAPARLGRGLRRLVSSERAEASLEPGALFPLAEPVETSAALSKVLRNLEVERGPVCFGHTHTPFVNVSEQGFEFSNSGSWVLELERIKSAHYRRWARPGSVLEVQGGKISQRDLLEDLSLEEIALALNG